jgi:hypothetical protein
MKRRMAASLATIFFGLPAPVAVSFAYWFNKVRKGGAWDYKRHGGTEAQGNLNYGATGELLFSLDTLLRAAGAVQDHPAPNIHGHWYDFPPSNYGDQAEDIPDIKEGFSRCHGTSG